MKIVLQVQSGSLTGKSYELEEGALSLGRGTDCSIQFGGEGDEGVSKNHLKIESASDGYYAIDQGSTNGTFVNGARIERALLKSGDVIRLGLHNPLIQVSVQAAAAASPGAEPVAASAAPPATAAAPVSAPAPSAPVAAAAPSSPVSAPAPSAPVAAASAPAPQPGPAMQAPAALMNVLHGFGGFNPDQDKGEGRSLVGTIVIIVVLFLGMIAIAFCTLLDMSNGQDIVSALAGAVLAFAFGPIYLTIWMWLNRYDPAPPWLLVACILWGGGVAGAFAFIVNTVEMMGAGTVLGPQNGEIFGASILGPINEETLKGIGVLLVYLLVRKEFDGILDGIVFAGVIALGFAMTEDVGYYASQMHGGGIGALLAIFVMRGIFQPFAHATFTSMTGIGCGISRESHNRVVKWIAPPIGYLCAIFLHFCWNTFGTLLGAAGLPGLLPIILPYLLFFVPVFCILIGFITWQTLRESKVIKKMLTPEVEEGLLTMQQVGLVASYMQRVGWLAGSISNFPRLTARRKFLHAATKLALSYWHVERAEAAHSHTMSGALVPLYRKQVIALKDKI